MIIDINKIPQGHSNFSQSIQVNKENEKWLTVEGEINCNAEIDRLGSRIFVHLFYKCNVCTECSRCLNPIKLPLSGDFRVVLEEKTHSFSKEPVLEDEIDIYFNSSDETIDLSQMVYEEIILSIPMKPLCSESCNTNEEENQFFYSTESNKDKQIDSRWEVLKKIKNKNQQ